ncbi:MAG: nucleotidyltransferase family protein [Acidobacteriota bacterium]
MRRDDVLGVLASHSADLGRFGVKFPRPFGLVAPDKTAEGSEMDLLVSFEKPTGFSSLMKPRIFLEDPPDPSLDLVTENGLRDRVGTHVGKETIRVA